MKPDSYISPKDVSLLVCGPVCQDLLVQPMAQAATNVLQPNILTYLKHKVCLCPMIPKEWRCDGDMQKPRQEYLVKIWDPNRKNNY